MFEQLRQNYVASFEAKKDLLIEALEQQDVQVLRVAVHQLTGSSGSYGFDDISLLSSELEKLFNATDTIELKTHSKTQQLIDLLTAYSHKA